MSGSDTMAMEGFSVEPGLETGEPNGGYNSAGRSSAMSPPSKGSATMGDAPHDDAPGADLSPRSAANFSAASRPPHYPAPSTPSATSPISLPVALLIPIHDGPSNPLGPIPNGGRTTTSTRETVDPNTGRKTRSETYATVLLDGTVYRTTLSRAQGETVTGNDGTPLTTTTYERSVPGGDTTRIDVVRLPDSTVRRTTEIIKPGGSSTVIQERIDARGQRLSVETTEYPPMEIVSRPVGWDKYNARGRDPYRGGAVDADDADGDDADGTTTVVSELTYPRLSRPMDVDDGNTAEGHTLQFEDPTADPTFVNYEAGYCEAMAAKHSGGGGDETSGGSNHFGSAANGGGRHDGSGGSNGGGGGGEGTASSPPPPSKDAEEDENTSAPIFTPWWTWRKRALALGVIGLVLGAAAIGAGLGAAAVAAAAARTSDEEDGGSGSGDGSNGQQPPSYGPTTGPTTTVQAVVPIEVRAVDGPMSSDDGTVFEVACGNFLSGEFDDLGSPLEKVRCEVDGQDLVLGDGRRRDNRGRRRRAAADRTLRIEIRASASFVPTNVFADARSVEFEENVKRFLDDGADRFIRYLGQEADKAGTDYFDGVAIVSVVVGTAVEPVALPTLPPVTDPPTPGPTAVHLPTLPPVTGPPTPGPTAVHLDETNREEDEQKERVPDDEVPTRQPTPYATPSPADRPTPSPTPQPSKKPSPRPTLRPTRDPTIRPTPYPTPRPTPWPTPQPSEKPTPRPTPRPTRYPTIRPTPYPTPRPTPGPTPQPMTPPSPRPTRNPTPKPEPQPTPFASATPSFCLNSECWVQIGSDLVGSSPNDEFGDRVQIDGSGTRFSVSATKSSESGEHESGTVRVYSVLDDGTFLQIGQPIHGGSGGDQIHGLLSEDGRHLAVGNSHAHDSTGSVKVYKLISGSWSRVGRTIHGDDDGERFGTTVAISKDGTIVASGAPFAYDKRGAVRVYKWSGRDWEQMGSDIRGEFQDGKFGWSIALASGVVILAIGQKSDDAGRSGQVRVFRWNGADDFVQLGDAVLGTSPGSDFGKMVAISSSGTTFAAGANFHDSPNGVDSGQVRVFSYDNGGGTWYQTPSPGSDIDGDAPDDLMMKCSLARGGSRVAAGTGSGDDLTGYVRVYDNTGNEWKQVGGKISGQQPGEKFGNRFSLSPDGTRLLVGAPARNVDNMKGLVRLYELRTV